MLMKCMPGSKILVTSRSKPIVTQLLRHREDIDMWDSEQEDSASDQQVLACVQGNMIMRHSRVPLPCKTVSVLEVPSLTELEAMEVLKSRSCYSRFIPEDCLRSLARSCFFGEQCHPLCLKLRGNELRSRGRASFDDQRWKSLISGLQDAVGAPAVDSIEQAVLQVVGKSFDGLPSQLQDIFAHMATCGVLAERDVEETIMLLRVLRYDDFTEDMMRCEVINKLEYYGLVDIVVVERWEWDGKPEERLVIHDLHKQVAGSRVSSAAAACGLCAGSHDVESERKGEDLSDVSTQKVMSRKYVRGHNVPESTWKAMFPQVRCRLSDCFLRYLLVRPPQAQIRYLRLWRPGSWARSLQLGVGNIMTGLRALRLHGDVFNKGTRIKEIQGWEGVPNLVWLELRHLPDLETMGPIFGCLKKLERLIIHFCGLEKLETIVGTDEGKSLVRVGDLFPKLQHVDLRYSCQNLVEVGPAFSDVFPALKELSLHGCRKLRNFPELKSGRSLRVLDLSGCSELRRIEGSTCSLKALQHLHLSDCTRLESMPDMSNVVSLRSLKISGCCWRFVTTTSNADGQQDNLAAGVLEVNHGHRQSQPNTDQLSDAGTGISCVNVDISLIHLRSLFIDAALSDSAVGLLNLSGLPSLRTVSLRSFGSVRKLSFSSSELEWVVIGNFPCLEEICWFGAHQYKHLHTLSILDCPLLVRTPGLDGLPFQNLKIAKGDHEGLMCLNLPIAASLQDLEVEDCSSWTDVSSLASLKCLVSLRLRRCTSMKDISGLAADLNTTLTHLHLYGCTALMDVSSLAGLTSLADLKLYGCTALSDVSSLTGLSSLEKLWLDGCSALTDLVCLTSLKYFRLDGCTALKNVTSLAGLTSLTKLELIGCRALTDVSNLASLTSLAKLELIGCTALTDVSSLAGLTSLTTLQLCGCIALTDLSSLAGLTSLTRLL